MNEVHTPNEVAISFANLVTAHTHTHTDAHRQIHTTHTHTHTHRHTYTVYVKSFEWEKFCRLPN